MEGRIASNEPEKGGGKSGGATVGKGIHEVEAQLLRHVSAILF